MLILITLGNVFLLEFLIKKLFINVRQNGAVETLICGEKVKSSRFVYQKIQKIAFIFTNNYESTNF